MRISRPLVLLVSLTLAEPAAAQLLPPPEDPAPIDVARDGGEQGLRLFALGKLEDAYEAFRRADRVYHAPTLVLYMAHCQKRLGRLASARALYLKVVDEHVASTAPVQFLTAQMVARTEVSHLDPRVPALTLELTGGSPAQATVRVDGEVTPPALWQSVELDPGDHIVDVRSAAGPSLRRSVHLKEGARLKLTLALPGPSPSPGAPVAGVAAPPIPSVGPARAASRSLVPAWIAFGTGAAALGVGTVTGVLSLGKAAELKASCDASRVCPSSAQPIAVTAGHLADASTTAFVVAGAAVAAGVVLVVVRPGARRDAELGLSLGPRSVVVKGRF